MPHYRLYILRGSHIEGVEEIDAPTDMAAMDAARAFAGEDGLELWQEGRKVGRIEPNDLGSQLIERRRALKEAQAGASEDRFKTA